MTFQEFIGGFLGASAVEIVASISGLLCIYLLIKRNIWCWFFGLIQVSLYSYVFFQAKLYSDTALHVVYIVLQFYGWWNWKKHKMHDSDLIVESGSLSSFGSWWLLAFVSAGSLGWLMSAHTDASFAYADAFTTCSSLIAQFLLTRRYWFNWLFWIIVDVVAIYIYLQKGLYPTAILYFVLLVMCFFGLYAWLKQAKAQTTLVNAHA